MIDLLQQPLSELNKQQAQGYQSLEIKKHSLDDYSKYDEFIATGDAKLRKEKAKYALEQEHCHRCGKAIKRRPWLFNNSSTLCKECEKIAYSNCVVFYSNNGEQYTQYELIDFIQDKVKEQDRTQQILNLLKLCF